jgi:cytochrome d ubiquinol oxidase subunit II
LTGVCLVFGYALLGAGWLVLKTEDALQAQARDWSRIALIGVAGAVLLVSIWTPVMNSDIRDRWFGWPNFVLLSPVPVITLIIGWATWRSITNGLASYGPFLGAIGLFVMSYLGIAISLFPMIVPHHFTLWQAASDPSTQAFLLVGTLFLLPVILVYTGWSYWVFRGKVRADIGYE